MKNLRFQNLSGATAMGLMLVTLSSSAFITKGGGLGPFYVNDENDHGCLKNPTNVKKSCDACQENAPGPQGMPAWSVTEPFLNVWVADEPAAYRTSLGEEIPFRVTYKQRDVRSTAHKFIPFTTGGWSHNWFSYAHFRDASAGTFCQFDCVVY